MAVAPETVLAGGALLFYGFVGLLLYVCVCLGMYKCSKETAGFRFLLSMSVADMLLLVQFGVWPGIVILNQKAVIPTQYRWHVHVYFDFVWFSMCYHYPLVAWTRLQAIRRAMWFKGLTNRYCYRLCGLCWLLGAVQSVGSHLFPQYVIFYIEPAAYGMVCEDFPKYLAEGTWHFYFIFHLIVMTTPFFFYILAVRELCKKRRSVGTAASRQSNAPTSTSRSRRAGRNRQISFEKRLLIPCFINSIVFLLGQVSLNLGVYGGKWGAWMIMVMFLTNSFVNPVLYLISASFLRRKVAETVCCMGQAEINLM